jgi:hypothetical protein
VQPLVRLSQGLIIRRQRFTRGHALLFRDGEGVLDLADRRQQHLDFVLVQLH